MVRADTLRDKRPQFLRVFDTEYQHFKTIPKGIRAYAIAVYVCLASHASSKTDVVFPSHATICDHTGLSKPTVIKAIDALVESGHITVHNRSNKGERSSNLYTLLSVVVNDAAYPDVVGNVADHPGNVAAHLGNVADYLVNDVDRNQTNESDQETRTNESEGERARIMRQSMSWDEVRAIHGRKR
jgi:biotin operon repressor